MRTFVTKLLQSKRVKNKINDPVEAGGFPFDCLAESCGREGGEAGEKVRKTNINLRTLGSGQSVWQPYIYTIISSCPGLIASSR